MAHEAGVPFYFASGSEFVELFVGVGAKRMRELFEMARQHAPAIIFIDEIDTIAGTRGTKNTNSEETKTLVQLLTELDGVVESENPIVVIAATNRPDILDPALLRPRRFDKMIFVPMPDKKARKEIINVHLQSKPLDPSLDRFQIIEKLATMTTGFSGADIENLINEANLISIKKKKKYIDWEDIKEAYDKITLGLEPGYVLDEDTKKRVAYHEAGHAINAWAIRKKVDLVSILPRSKALGLVRTKEENDKYLYTYNDLFNEIVMLLGGRAAEEIYFSELSTGAANDLKKATQIAKDMITKYGFDSLIVYESTESAWHKESILSPSTDIETKIEHILKKAYEIAKQNITNNEILYNKLVEALLQKEVIDEEEFERIMSEKNDQEEH
jgi:cell division protease FtsH